MRFFVGSEFRAFFSFFCFCSRLLGVMVLWAALLFCDYLSFTRLLWLRFVVLVAGWVGVFAPFFLVFCLCCFGFAVLVLVLLV
jgi:hypothetical protein